MAAGIGEASAVVQILELGFSLTRTLTTFIADAKDAPGDIASLATEVDATLRQVEELNALLLENETTKGWNENGIIFAKKCRTDALHCVKKLVNLLKKTGSGLPETGTIEREDIDLSLFRRVAWLRFKPRVEVVKHELERTRIDILLARDFYKVKKSTSEEEQNLVKARLVDLLKTKQRVKEELRRARQAENETVPRKPSDLPPTVPPPRHDAYAFSEERALLPSGPPRRVLIKGAHIEDDDSSQSTDSSRGTKNSLKTKREPRRFDPRRRKSESEVSIVDYPETASSPSEDTRENSSVEAKREISRSQCKAHAARRALETAMSVQKAKEAAVEAYRASLVDEIARHRSKLEDDVAQMQAVFGPTVPVAQIRTYLEQRQQRDMGKEVAKIHEALMDRTKVAGISTGERRFKDSTVSSTKNTLQRSEQESPNTGIEASGSPGSHVLEHLSLLDWERSSLILVSYGASSWAVTRCYSSAHAMKEAVSHFTRNGTKETTLLAETMRVHSQMPSKCKQVVERYLEEGDRRKYDWDLLFALCHHSKPRLSQKLVNLVQRKGQVYMLAYMPWKRIVEPLSNAEDYLEGRPRRRLIRRAGLFTGAAGGYDRRAHSKSGDGRNRHESRPAQGVPIASAGLGGTALAGLYEKKKAKKKVKRIVDIEDETKWTQSEGSQSRSWSRSRTASARRDCEDFRRNCDSLRVYSRDDFAGLQLENKRPSRWESTIADAVVGGLTASRYDKFGNEAGSHSSIRRQSGVDRSARRPSVRPAFSPWSPPAPLSAARIPDDNQHGFGDRTWQYAGSTKRILADRVGAVEFDQNSPEMSSDEDEFLAEGEELDYNELRDRMLARYTDELEDEQRHIEEPLQTTESTISPGNAVAGESEVEGGEPETTSAPSSAHIAEASSEGTRAK